MRLLLDAHIDPAVASGLVVRTASEVLALRDWEGGRYLNAADEVILRAAHASGFTLVTFDQRTVPGLLLAWGMEGTAHSGVIFVDEHTIAQNDIGGLIRALLTLLNTSGDLDWENRADFLHP